MISRLKVFLTTRPALALFAAVLMSCVIALTGLDIYVHFTKLKDPAVQKHWNKLLFTLSDLDFCFSNSTSTKTLSASYDDANMLPENFISSDHTGAVKSRSAELTVTVRPTPELVLQVEHRLIAQMRGRHLGVTGPLALQRLNVSFVLPIIDRIRCLSDRDCEPISTKICITLTSSPDMFPDSLLQPACSKPVRPFSDVYRTHYGQLEWSKRSDVFARSRCNNRIILQPQFHVDPNFLPQLQMEDIQQISFNLRSTIITLLLLLLGLLVCGSIRYGGPSYRAITIADGSNLHSSKNTKTAVLSSCLNSPADSFNQAS